MEFAVPGTITNARDEVERAAREKASATPLSEFHPGNPELFRSDSFRPYFDRLRKEEPVHYCKGSIFGPYWSVTKYNDILDIRPNLPETALCQPIRHGTSCNIQLLLAANGNGAAR
jgi:hypothetical protein